MNVFKDYLGNTLVAFVFMAYIGLATSAPISIGYFLYLWGSIGIMLAPAAWAAFVLWASICGGALIVLLTSTGILLFL